MVNVVVTDGAGGSVNSSSCCAQGDQVRGSMSYAFVDMDPLVDYVQADLAVRDADAIAGFDPVTIYHLAATFERNVEA